MNLGESTLPTSGVPTYGAWENAQGDGSMATRKLEEAMVAREVKDGEAPGLGDCRAGTARARERGVAVAARARACSDGDGVATQ